MVELRINGEITDLPKDVSIKHTLQVHDIADVSSVNASYTNSFKLKKTPTNTQIMQGLGMTGDGSLIPYLKTRADLLEDGIPIIYNGWLNVKNTNDEYNVSVIEGIIDFFKALDNIKFGTDVTLPELNHQKSVQAVIDSLNSEYYRYLINDYGGKNNLAEQGIGLLFTNIDYQVPSARVKYIWDRIFELLGFTYSGSIFESEDFQNAWVTFPKSNSVPTYLPLREFKKETIGANYWWNVDGNVELLGVNGFYWDSFTIINPGYISSESQTQYRLPQATILQTDNFRFSISFSAKTTYHIRANQLPITIKTTAPIKLLIYRNGNKIGQVIANGEEREFNYPLVAGDVISYRMAALEIHELWAYAAEQDNTDFPFNLPSYLFNLKKVSGIEFDSLELKIDQVEFEGANFEDAFKDLSPKEFVKDVMQRFALTPIPDKYESHITFYRLDEMLDKSKAIDWTDKYVKRTNEAYTYDNYAQSNIFQHKYTEEGENHSNGILNIFNENLEESKVIVNSKYFAPEENLASLRITDKNHLVRPTLIWTKEIEVDEDENITIKYKGNTGRYFWLKSKRMDETIIYVSEILGQNQSASSYNIADTHNTTYSDFVPKYYTYYQQILNNTRIHEIELNLSAVDVLNLDFSVPYYFEQEQSFYKLNKIIYEAGKPSKGEFIKLNPDG